MLDEVNQKVSFPRLEEEIVRAIADRCPLWSMTFGEKTSISFGRVRLSSKASDFLQRTAMT